MNSVGEKTQPRIVYAAADDQMLTVTLSDGRRLSLPLDWYPRLKHGSPAERNNWRLIGDGEGIHWPDLDEDLSVDGFIEGRRSVESRQGFRGWLQQRNKAATRKRKTA